MERHPCGAQLPRVRPRRERLLLPLGSAPRGRSRSAGKDLPSCHQSEPRGGKCCPEPCRRKAVGASRLSIARLIAPLVPPSPTPSRAGSPPFAQCGAANDDKREAPPESAATQPRTAPAAPSTNSRLAPARPPRKFLAPPDIPTPDTVAADRALSGEVRRPKPPRAHRKSTVRK